LWYFREVIVVFGLKSAGGGDKSPVAAIWWLYNRR